MKIDQQSGRLLLAGWLSLAWIGLDLGIRYVGLSLLEPLRTPNDEIIVSSSLDGIRRAVVLPPRWREEALFLEHVEYNLLSDGRSFPVLDHTAFMLVIS